MIYKKKNTPFMRSNAYTNCYKCNPSYVLKGMTCVYTEGKTYLKIPMRKCFLINYTTKLTG